MAEPKHLNSIPINHIVQSRPNIPSDYHCDCPYCQKFMGEIYNIDQDKYYSNRIRKEYYLDKAGDHLDVGHVIGYKWAVQNLCPEGGVVLDPTAGTGTAVVESIINGRNGIGIELEYPEVGKQNIQHQWQNGNAVKSVLSRFRQGDATKIDEYLAEWGFTTPFVDLVINGTPYPKMSGKSSDAPERKNLKTGQDKSFDYMHEDNIGLTKGDAYWDLVRTIYTKSLKYLKPGGYFVILIKDLVQDKEPYLLHKYITDVVMEANPDMEYHGFFLHKHIPTTMFINTYNKRFPGIKIPLYQTGIVLRKKGGNDAGFPVEEIKNIREIIPSEPCSSKSKKEKVNKEKSIPQSENKEDPDLYKPFKEGYDQAIKDTIEYLKSKL